jgi:hypothetical protein
MKQKQKYQMVAFSDQELHKLINILATEEGIVAQEVVRKGIELYLTKLKRGQEEFISRMAKR